VTDADEFSEVSWFPREKRNALRRLIAEVAWEQGGNTQATDRAIDWLTRAGVRFIVVMIIAYSCVIVLLALLVAVDYYVNTILAYAIYFAGLLGYVGFFRSSKIYRSYLLAESIVHAIAGAQDLVRNPSDAKARRKALQSIARIPRRYLAYVAITVSGNAPRRLRIEHREIWGDEVLAILRLFEPTLYASTRSEFTLLRDDLVRLLLRVANGDLKSISLIGSSWPLRSSLADARDRSGRFALGLAPSGAGTFVLPLVIALIGALGAIIGGVLSK
jgi:hypothetical protein